ncbi:MAG: glycoside hydrolase, partial [Planctomycetes bacterium]|nr:glycoside hydrolase [Planctomycetota bacterium]
MSRKRFVAVCAGLLCLATAHAASPTGTYNIRDFGARPGGETVCTEAIQSAIDQCAKEGGGTVLFPPGMWLTGTVYLESHVTVRLENGCTVLGSKDKTHYGRPRQPLDGDE